MPKYIDCPSCKEKVPASAIQCDCGQDLVPTPTDREQPVEPVRRSVEKRARETVLTLHGFDPVVPAGSPVCIGIRFCPGRIDVGFTKVNVRIECDASMGGPIPLRRVKGAADFDEDLQFIAPQGGEFKLKVMVECQTVEGGLILFEGRSRIGFIDNSWSDAVLTNKLKGMIVELRNKRGLLRVGSDMQGVDHLIVDSDEGLTRLMGDIRQGKQGSRLSWDIPLQRQDQDPRPQSTHAAHLRIMRGGRAGYTRLYARDRLVLGRAFADLADFWLRSIPQDPTIEGRVSRCHAEIRWRDGFQLQDHSTCGIYQDGQALPRDTWVPLPSATLLATVRDHLNYHFEPVTQRSLRISRDGPQAEKENAILIEPVAGQLYSAAITKIPEPSRFSIAYSRGGFVLHSRGEEVAHNGMVLPEGRERGLHDGDRVATPEIEFEFRTKAYAIEG